MQVKFRTCSEAPRKGLAEALVLRMSHMLQAPQHPSWDPYHVSQGIMQAVLDEYEDRNCLAKYGL